MTEFLSLDLQWRFLLIAVTGLVAGNLINWAIARWRIKPLDFHPWTTTNPQRRWWHYLPVIGWLTRNAEESQFGRHFATRPLFIELGIAILWVAMYWWCCIEHGLVDGTSRFTPDDELAAHWHWLCWAVMSVLMIGATFIDFDEQIIPDQITVPGTLFGLIAMTLLPNAAMPWVDSFMKAATLLPVHVASPRDWPMELSQSGPWSLWLGLGCWVLWCIGLLPRVWYSHLRIGKAWRYFWAIILRDGSYRWIIPLMLVGCTTISVVWSQGSAAQWQGLLTALIGMAIGGLTIWFVRIIGALALGREAMGFGDVTLMAMIGTITGWQAILPIFFAAPFAGMFLGIARWVMQGDNMLPYGPFLCLATWFVWFTWLPVWNYMERFLELGFLIPSVMGVFLVLLGVILGLLRLIRGG
jgi:leader peptidase (prepilin peptidase) / N-methyltransferase